MITRNNTGPPSFAEAAAVMMSGGQTVVGESAKLQKKEVTLSTSAIIKPDSGYDGMSEVNVTVTGGSMTGSLYGFLTNPNIGELISEYTMALNRYKIQLYLAKNNVFGGTYRYTDNTKIVSHIYEQTGEYIDDCKINQVNRYPFYATLSNVTSYGEIIPLYVLGSQTIIPNEDEFLPLNNMYSDYLYNAVKLIGPEMSTPQLYYAHSEQLNKSEIVWEATTNDYQLTLAAKVPYTYSDYYNGESHGGVGHKQLIYNFNVDPDIDYWYNGQSETFIAACDFTGNYVNYNKELNAFNEYLIKAYPEIIPQ